MELVKHHYSLPVYVGRNFWRSFVPTLLKTGSALMSDGSVQGHMQMSFESYSIVCKVHPNTLPPHSPIPWIWVCGCMNRQPDCFGRGNTDETRFIV